MPLTAAPPPAHRLRGLLVLLLLSLGLLAGVSVSQSHQLEQQVQRLDAATGPALRQVHGLATALDGLRGLSALHLTLRDPSERQAVETRIQAARVALQQQLAAHGHALADEGERRHLDTVAQRLVHYLALEDRLLAASRRAAVDPQAVDTARALLTGPTEQAYRLLRAGIEAWWDHVDAEAARAAALARAAAHRAVLSVWAAAALAGLGLAVAWALWLQRAPRPPRPPAPPPDDGQVQHHLQVLQAAVAAARRGEPGRAVGLSALEARRLADQVADATRGLRGLIARRTD